MDQYSRKEKRQTDEEIKTLIRTKVIICCSIFAVRWKKEKSSAVVFTCRNHRNGAKYQKKRSIQNNRYCIILLLHCTAYVANPHPPHQRIKAFRNSIHHSNAFTCQTERIKWKIVYTKVCYSATVRYEITLETGNNTNNSKGKSSTHSYNIIVFSFRFMKAKQKWDPVNKCNCWTNQNCECYCEVNNSVK